MKDTSEATGNKPSQGEITGTQAVVASGAQDEGSLAKALEKGEEKSDALGKKAIFLYPPNVIADALEFLSNHEFEVYVLHDHERLEAYLAKHGNAIVFVNIDTGMKEAEWEIWLRKRIAEGHGERYGILTYNENKSLAAKYLFEVGVSCGFIVLKVGVQEAIKILLKTLEANEARGKRRYLRASSLGDSAEFNIMRGGWRETGKILDISAVGMAARFESTESLPVGTKLHDLQISMKGFRVSVDAIVYGQREEAAEGRVHILIFDPASLDDVKRAKLRTSIRRSLQDAFEHELGSM